MADPLLLQHSSNSRGQIRHGVTSVDCLQIDATRCGGYTEWLRAAAVAAGHELEVWGHCAPNLHVHVAAATPNLRHLEWFHDHVRIEDLAFDGVLDPSDGVLAPDVDAVGHGLSLRREAMRPYLLAQHDVRICRM